jgi:hypothetical protein
MSIVSSVIERNVALAVSSISPSTEASAASLPLCLLAPFTARPLMSSKSSITSISVIRFVFPLKR